jgi:hypothetical protein
MLEYTERSLTAALRAGLDFKPGTQLETGFRVSFLLPIRSVYSLFSAFL